VLWYPLEAMFLKNHPQRSDRSIENTREGNIDGVPYLALP